MEMLLDEVVGPVLFALREILLDLPFFCANSKLKFSS